MTTTELTLPERAAVALGAAVHEKKLALLAQEAKTIIEIKNKDGREQCHSMMMTLKNARVSIAKSGKAAREDATAFSNAVIAEEKRLIAITQAEEERLQKLRDEWDAAIEAERQAKIEAERQRVTRIQEAMESIRAIPAAYVGKPAEAIAFRLKHLRSNDFPSDGFDFMEFAETAGSAMAVAIAKLEELHAAATQQEAEAARVAAERVELARLRAEAEARKAEDERKAAEARAIQEAAFQSERERMAKEQAKAEAELQRQREVQEAELRAQREAQQRELEAEQARMAAERAEIERQQAEVAEAARLREEQEAERVRLQAAADQALADAREPLPVAPVAWPFPVGRTSLANETDKEMAQRRPPNGYEIVALVAESYDVPMSTAIEWLRAIDFATYEADTEAAA